MPISKYLIAATWLLLLLGEWRFVCAEDRVILRDGFTLTGRIDLQENRILVESGPRIYYVSTQQLLKPEAGGDLTPPVSFIIPLPPMPRPKKVEGIADIVKVGPFDSHGRRSVTIHNYEGKTYTAVQAITAVTPTHVVLEGVDVHWKSTLSLMQLSTPKLLEVLEHRRQPSPDDELGIVQLLIQAGRVREAKEKLERLKRQSPERESQTRELQELLRRRFASDGLATLERAIAAAQWKKAHQVHETLSKENLPTDTAQTVRALGQELHTQARKQTQALMVLDTLLAKARAEKSASWPALEEIRQNLTMNNLGRLQPFLQLANQASTSSNNAIALALTGWALGPTLAQTDLAPALDIWNRRQEVQRAISASDEVALALHSRALRDTKPDLLPLLISMLPAPTPAPTPAEGPPEQARAMEVVADGVPTSKYLVQLPAEYDPYREYPTIVALHPLAITPERTLQYWGPLAREFGFIVIAPAWQRDLTRAYEYSLEEHQVFLEMIYDVRRRFAVDADRLFLAGHERGANAAWDLAMAHPDLFAGLISFNGTPQLYCQRYVTNLQYLPVYAVNGSQNFVNSILLQKEFIHYFAKGYDVLYAEYAGCGPEPFVGELPTIFDWMTRKRRKTSPSEINATSARHTDRRFYWLQADAFRSNATVAPELFKRSRFVPAEMRGKITDKNNVLITTKGLDQITLLFSPRWLQLDAPELTIRVKGKVIHKGPVTLDLDTLLREVRRTGDRKFLIYKTLTTNKL